ncbi:5527_t:CDS:1, partial [Ambispora leptoticha]
ALIRKDHLQNPEYGIHLEKVNSWVYEEMQAIRPVQIYDKTI